MEFREELEREWERTGGRDQVEDGQCISRGNRIPTSNLTPIFKGVGRRGVAYCIDIYQVTTKVYSLFKLTLGLEFP